MFRLAIISSVCLVTSLSTGLALADESVPSAEENGSAASEETDRPDTLFGGNPYGFRHHMYIAPSLGATSLNGHLAYDIGLRGAYLLNDNFAIGFAGHAMGWDGRSGDNRFLDDSRQLMGGYGGLMLQYRLAPHSVVHGLFDTTLGGGALCTRSTRDDDCKASRGFGVIESTSNVEVNLTHYLRVSLGGGYRLALASERDGISGSDLSGFVGRTTLEFGWF